jgi:hypothetical protein
MGSRYLFICLYVWLEKYFSRGDYRKKQRRRQRAGKRRSPVRPPPSLSFNSAFFI